MFIKKNTLPKVTIKSCYTSEGVPVNCYTSEDVPVNCYTSEGVPVSAVLY